MLWAYCLKQAFGAGLTFEILKTINLIWAKTTSQYMQIA